MRLEGIVLGEDPSGLERLGLTVRGDQTHVGGVVLQAVGADGPRGLLALDLDGAAADGPLPLAAVGPGVADGADRPAPHPLGAVAVDHVVVLCGDVEATIAALGTVPRRVDVRDGRCYGFVVADTALLEFVGPASVEDRAPRLWGLALTVADLDAAAAHLGPACGEPKDAVQPGRRIVTVRHEPLGLATPTVLLTPRV